jgi:Fe2+ or Zn2+ uptake regulation protein
MKKRNLREHIIRLLQNNHLLSVAAIMNALAAEQQSFNKTSVYRAIDQLVADDVICQHYLSGTEAHYELREHHHAHLVCKVCGSVETADCGYEPSALIGDFQADHHHLTVFGVCMECR